MSNKNKQDSPELSVRVAALQMNSGNNMKQNLELAAQLLVEAATDGCVMAILPENFSFMGSRQRDKLQYAEELGNGPIQEFLADMAYKNKIWIVSGSIPLKSAVANCCYNATLVLDAKGNMKNCYRKIHLFDVDLPNRYEQYRESASTAPGETVVTQNTPVGCLGLSICYDLRFPELYRKLVDMGAVVLAVPAAFTLVTGKAHWHTLLRARAIENLAYVLAPNQFGQDSNGRSTYGHSLIIDPWGQILAEASEGNCIITADLDPSLPQKLRSKFPALSHRVLK
jgi:nitrilase